MAELIHMRQRINTVETIKKITHAMRLVSMSTHAKLHKQYAALEIYHAGITNILAHVMHASQSHSSQQNLVALQRAPITLLIAVGSQKGLCGSFNSTLFRALDDYITKKCGALQIILVGKKIVDYAQERYKSITLASFPHLTLAHLPAIAQAISDRIFANNDRYASVSLLSTVQKNFFVQITHITPLLPVHITQEISSDSVKDYTWDLDPQTLVEHLTRQYIVSALRKALLESLLAEHAARFVSMDSATRNAEKILETTRLKYNKLRQAKITKELLELADTF